VNWKTCAIEELPDTAGCYAIYCDGHLVYVGQSTNVRQRIAAHRIGRARYSNWFTTTWGSFRSVVVKVRRSHRLGDWLMHEYRLIRRLNPTFNRRYTA
jgi:excinuclease UvrABC nuclease subunit